MRLLALLVQLVLLLLGRLVAQQVDLVRRVGEPVEA